MSHTPSKTGVELEAIDRQTTTTFHEIAAAAEQRGTPLDAMTAFELHRQIWASNAGAATVIRVAD